MLISQELVEEIMDFIEAVTSDEIISQNEDGTVVLTEEGERMEDLRQRLHDETGHVWE